MSKYIPLILAGVLLNAFAQILLKKGMLSIGYFEFQFQNFFPIIKKVTINLYVLSVLASVPLSSAIRFPRQTGNLHSSLLRAAQPASFRRPDSGHEETRLQTLQGCGVDVRGRYRVCRRRHHCHEFSESYLPPHLRVG